MLLIDVEFWREENFLIERSRNTVLVFVGVMEGFTRVDWLLKQ